MESTFIVYLPGRAGNFLARLLSLDATTMPQMSLSDLNTYLKRSEINKSVPVIVTNESLRLDSYLFTKEARRTGWQKFHRQWADHYNTAEYRLLGHFWQRDRLVHQIHPYEFTKFEEQIKIYNPTYFYVDLNEEHNEWINSAQLSLGFKIRPNEITQGSALKEKFKMQTINLSVMLTTVSGFIDEYQRMCNLSSIPETLDLALALYHNWKSIRYD